MWTLRLKGGQLEAKEVLVLVLDLLGLRSRRHVLRGVTETAG